MDPEPDRCRRTDGRKWRCSKNAVPTQKYCELHMYRGRQGSRKHVEHNTSFSKPDNKLLVHNRMPISSSVTSDVDYKIALSAKNSLGHNQTSEKGSHAEGKESSLENAINPRKKHGMAKSNNLGFISPGFGSSPKSVYHCGAGKVGPGSGTKNTIESVPQRCRRTDGKKWQCGLEALPNQKYCQRHIHRGAKRVMSNPGANFPTPSSRRAVSSNTISRRDNGINLNTIPASLRLISGDSS